jgi:hypothetical protein
VPVTGEVPEDLLNAIIADLVERIQADRKEIQVTRAEQVTWSDGSLGCPKPGELYTQNLVDGYRVILSVNGNAYDYRASGRRYFFLCEKPQKPAP